MPVQRITTKHVNRRVTIRSDKWSFPSLTEETGRIVEVYLHEVGLGHAIAVFSIELAEGVVVPHSIGSWEVVADHGPS